MPPLRLRHAPAAPRVTESAMGDDHAKSEPYRIENTKYRGHVIKVAYRSNGLKILIYMPGEMLAHDIVEARISEYESAVMLAKAKIDQSM